MREFILRFVVALGGFLIFMGIIMVGVFVIVFLGHVDFSVLENQGYRKLSLWVLLMIGVFDLLSGIILRRK
jgi:hypothetical protein